MVKLRAKSVYDSLETIEQKLSSGSRLFYCRFGDGEIFILNDGYTRDHSHNPALTEAMKSVWSIDDPDFLKGVAVWYPTEPEMTKQVFAPFRIYRKLEDILLKFGAKEGAVYENFVVFHYLSLFDPKRMVAFLNNYVRPKKKLFIGSSDPEAVKYVFGEIDYYVQTPAEDAYSSFDEWFPKVKQYLDKVELVLPATGASTKIVMDRLWKMGYQGVCLDMGSVADVTQLRGTRTWITLLGHRSRKILLPGWELSGFFPQKKVRNLVGETKYYAKRLWQRVYFPIIDKIRDN